MSAEQYRLQWEAALRADGWVRHVESATRYRVEFEWWSRDDVGVRLTTRADDVYGEYFEWGAGDLVVTAHRVGTGSGMLPGPTP